MKMCLHQFIRPTLFFPKEGYGNCCVCQTDEKNVTCRGYYPITISIVEVTDGISPEKTAEKEPQA